ncbi:D-cysteine desulfhydrase family protein [Microbulbifer sp. CAU 1566]|uniref:D-cysteine desulfhydrase family protein n=1 Tax=Microbulbifer sp. CAU 1566 TaxID=2933269 RepID=UPI002002AE82|nr:D-cysteine desulfhydrase family protein [Microbulbifer sp. CAU 1566]MCK7596874.1 D-cysteine desulfhydrase family protein [Microbulbifer sp. CAU 1566]
MSIQYPAREPLANLPTPLQPLPRISEKYSQPFGGPKIWIKRDDLTESALSGNKLRKLEFIIAEAKATGCNTLITCGGVQSNHCRATALAAAKTDLRAHLILRGGRQLQQEEQQADGNLLVDYLAGAEVSVYPLRKYLDQLPSLFEHWEQYYQERGDKALAIPTGGSDGLGIWGYIRGAEELLEDCRRLGFAPEQVICASGSGGTQAGLTLGCQLLGAETAVTGYAVCDDTEYFVNKIVADIEDWRTRYAQSCAFDPGKIRVDDNYIGPGYGLATAEVYRTIAEAARLEGILLDPVYTGKAFYGLLQDVQSGKYAGVRNLVFVHTGGQFGVFPHRAEFMRSLGGAGGLPQD